MREDGNFTETDDSKSEFFFLQCRVNGALRIKLTCGDREIFETNIRQVLGSRSKYYVVGVPYNNRCNCFFCWIIPRSLF